MRGETCLTPRIQAYPRLHPVGARAAGGRQRQERFMRRVLALSAVGLSLVFAQNPALAQDYPHVIAGVHPAQAAKIRTNRSRANPAQDNLGGGFIEYLLTGSTRSAPVRRYVRPAPVRYEPQAYAPQTSVGYNAPGAAYAALASDEPSQAGAAGAVPPPGGRLFDQRAARRHRHRHARQVSLPRRGRRQGVALRHRRRPAGLRMGGRRSESRARRNGRAGRRRRK